MCEEKGPKWKVEELHRLPDFTSLAPPFTIPSDTPYELSIRASSPATIPTGKQTTVGRIKLTIKDHRDMLYEIWLTEEEIKADPRDHKKASQ